MSVGDRPLGASRRIVGPLAAALLLAACSPTGARAQGPPPAAPGSATDRSTSACGAFRAGLASARTPLDAMRSEAVLLPFVDLIELSTRQTAQAAASVPDPAVAAAMREVVGAIDDLDAQGRTALPPGADPARTTVRLRPERLANALDAADRACAPHAAPAGGH